MRNCSQQQQQFRLPFLFLLLTATQPRLFARQSARCTRCIFPSFFRNLKINKIKRFHTRKRAKGPPRVEGPVKAPP